MHPPDNAIVPCVDEKTQIQALDRTQPELPLRSGNPKKADGQLTKEMGRWP